MKYLITETPIVSFATIEQAESQTVVAYISCDVHRDNSVTARAAQLLYTDSLISGAGKYDRAAFLDAVNLLGATISASVSNGILTIFIKSKADVFAKVLAIIETMLTLPHFNVSELKRIKQTVTNAIKESKEDSRAIAHEQLRNAVYGSQDRRFTHTEDTLIESIKKISEKHLRELHTYMHSLSWTCSIIGSAENLERFKKTITKIHKTASHHDSFGIHQQKPPQPQILFRDIPSRQNIDFSIGAPIPITLHHPDFLPLLFGIAVLGKWGGFAGRLMSTVREQEGLTYGIYAGTETFMNEEQGYWRIMTFFSPNDSVKGLTSTFREINNIHTNGISRDELEKFKTILKTAQTLKNDSTSSLLSELHSYHMEKFSLEEIAEHKQKLLSVTLEDVNNALKTYLAPSSQTVSAVGPIKAVKKDLEAFMKTVS